MCFVRIMIGNEVNDRQILRKVWRCVFSKQDDDKKADSGEGVVVCFVRLMISMQILGKVWLCVCFVRMMMIRRQILEKVWLCVCFVSRMIISNESNDRQILEKV